MNRPLAKATDKMADVLVANNDTILILPRFGIKLGFGEKSVSEVCAAVGVDEELFLMVANIYSSSDYMPRETMLSVAQFHGLISYLLLSHTYYLTDRIPHIEQHLHHLADSYPKTQKEALIRFFDEYKNEIVSHFLFEENEVFPYVEQLLLGKKISSFNILQFETNHTNIEDKLGDLTNIIIKYLPDISLPQERTSVLFDLFQLSSDLRKHTFIEDHIFTPNVERLEKSVL